MRSTLSLLVVALVLIPAGGCRVRKERIRGKTAVEIERARVQVTAETTTVRIGRESARVPVPKVHVGADSTVSR